MNRIVFDSATLNKLAYCSEAVAVCDESGQVFGIFEPKLNLVPQVDEAELDRRMREEGKDYSTAEVLQYLERL